MPQLNVKKSSALKWTVRSQPNNKFTMVQRHLHTGVCHGEPHETLLPAANCLVSQNSLATEMFGAYEEKLSPK